jgi:hypothetical protein
MTDINNKQTTESFERTISDLFQKIFDELEFDCEYKHKDKYDKESYKYNFDNNKLEPTNSKVEDNPGKIMVDKAGYEALIDLKDKMRSKIESLQKEKDELIKTSKQVSDSGHKIADNNLKLQHLINDKLYADGYKIMNDIKIYIEFARKCDAFKNGGFVDMINLIAKTINDFIASQKKPVFY